MSGSDGAIVIDTALDPTGFNRGSEKLRSAMNSLVDSVNNLGTVSGGALQGMIPVLTSIRESTTDLWAVMQQNTFDKYIDAIKLKTAEVATDLSQLGYRAAEGFENADEIEKFEDQLVAAREKIDDIKAHMKELSDQKIETQAYAELMDEMGETDACLEALKHKQSELVDAGVPETSRQYKTLEQQIELLQIRMQNLNAETRAMEENGDAMISGAETEEYQRLAQALEVAEAAYNGYTAAAEQAHAAAERSQAIDNLRSSLASAGSVIAGLAGKMVGLAQGGLQLLGSAARSAAQSFVGLAKSMTGKIFSAISNAAKSAVSGLLSFGRHGQSIGVTTQGLTKSLFSLKRMLVSRIKRSFISGIFKDFEAAKQALAKYSAAFNASMSGMQNASKGLSGNSAVAFGNLVNAIAPAVTTIINLISQAITYINAFFALLSGKGTMTVAKSGTDDYAKSLKKAGGAAKDLNEQVFSFDELNKEKDSSGGGGGGGLGDVQFEEVGIDKLLPNALLDYFTAVKEAIAASNWEEVGGLVADGLNYVVQMIDTGILQIQDSAMQWASNVARALNGLVDRLDWNLLGQTISDGFNLVLGVLRTALVTFDFGALGTKLGTMLNSAINGANWQLLGSTISAKWNAIFHTVLGFIATMDWATLGNRVYTGFESAVTTTDWEALTEIITTGFNSLWTAIGAFIDELPWIGLGESLAEYATMVIDGIDWAGMGEVISDAVTGLLDATIAFLETLDWQAIGTAVKDFVGAIDWAGIVDRLAEGIGAACAGLAAAIWAIIQESWTSVVEWWKDKAYDDGGFTINGLLDGISEALKNIGSWVKQHIFQPFIDGFKKVFGIASPSTVMEEQGGFLIDGLLAGITAGWEGITAFFAGVLDTLTQTLAQTWESISTAASTAWEGIKTTISTKFEDAKKALSDTAENIKTTISSAWETTKTKASTTWTTIKTTVTSKFTQTRNTLQTTAEGLQTTLSSKWEAMKSTAGTAWSDLKSDITQKFTDLKSDIKGVNWSDIGSNLVSGVKSGISSSFGEFSRWVSGKFSGIISSVKKTFGISSPSKVFAAIGEYLMEGLGVGVEDGESGAIRTVRDTARAIADSVDAEAEMSFGASSILSSLDGVTSGLASIASIFQSISDALLSMGGLQVPETAAGSVVPYSTRVSDIESVDGLTELQQNLSAAYNDQEELMTDQRDILREIRDLLGRLDLTIDARSLTRMLTSLQAADVRAYGGA